MATITKSFTEDVESSHKASWVFTFTCANVTASGSTVSVAVPTVTAKMTASGKTSARAFVNFANLYVGSIDANRSYAWYLESSWASGATKTLPFDTSSGTATPATFNTSALFTSSNKTTRTVNVTLKGEYRNSYNIYFNGSSWKGSSYWNEFEQSVSSLGTIATITLNAPPTFSSTQVSFTNDYSGVPYAGKTTANVTISSLSAKYGGDISSAVLKIGSQTASRTTNGTLSILLNAVGTFTPTVTVTDSRGQTTTVTLNAITVQGYNAPSVSFGTERTTSTGAPNDEGTYAVITPTFTFTDAIATLSAPTVAVTDDGGVGRTPTVTWYSTRAADGTLSGSVTWANLSSGDTVYGLVSITNGFNTQKSYQISVTPEDSEDTGTTVTQTLGSAFYTVDFYAGGHGIAFGQPASQDGFFCNMDAHFVDKSDVMRALFDFIHPVGSYYETSDTTFNPNTTWGGTWVLETEGLVHISAGTNYAVNGAPTDTQDGGSPTSATNNHTLTLTEIPSHNHNSKTLTGTFRVMAWSSTTVSGIVTKSNQDKNRNPGSGSNEGACTYTINATHTHDSQGGGGAHNHGNVSTMQPFIIVNRWHRIA